jgi:hypothetical protein
MFIWIAAEFEAVYFAEFDLQVAVSVEMETRFKERQHLIDATLHHN